MTDRQQQHGLYYILPDGSALCVRWDSIDDTAIRALGPLARAVMRAHLEAGIRLLDRVSADNAHRHDEPKPTIKGAGVTTDLRPR